MKNKKLLVLPFAMLFALSGCGTTPTQAPENGKLPEGGKVIENAEDSDKKLAEVVQDTSKTLNEKEHFGLELSFSSNASLKSEKLSASYSLNNFLLTVGADNLFSGTKENTRVGATLGEFAVNLDLNSTLEEAEPYEFKEELKFGGLGVYLDKGNLYVDASKMGLEEALHSLATSLQPLLESADQVDATTKALVEAVASDPETITSLLSMLFTTEGSETFNYKFKFADVVSEYPLATLKEEISEEEAFDLVEDSEEMFDKNTGLDWDELCKVYTYGDGFTGVEFNLPFSKLADNETMKEVGVAFAENSSINFAAVINEKGEPVGVSAVVSLDATVSNQDVKDQFGSELKVVLNAAFDLKFNYEANPVTFPESYDGYSVPNELAGSLLNF